ncbi:hypothetical protein, partial [Vibrio parahaemolyticus]
IPTTSVDDKPQITPEPTPNQESQTSPVQPQNSKLSSTDSVTPSAPSKSETNTQNGAQKSKNLLPNRKMLVPPS